MSLLSNLYLSFIRNIDGRVGDTLRYSFYKRRLKYLGKNVKIDTGIFMYGLKYISIGEGTHIDKYCIIAASTPELDLSHRALKEVYNMDITAIKGSLVIGRDCHISQCCMIYSYGGVKLGNNCVMSTGCKLYSLSSLPFNPHDKKLRSSIVPYSGVSPSIIGNIEFEDNVWAGINVCVFPGVKIGKDSFVRSNSIVVESFHENSYIAGDPAKFIKRRYDE